MCECGYAEMRKCVNAVMRLSGNAIIGFLIIHPL